MDNILNSQMEDMFVLENIMKENVEIENIDTNTKKRLIEACSKRLEQVNTMINEKELEIKKIDEIIDKIEKTTRFK